MVLLIGGFPIEGTGFEWPLLAFSRAALASVGRMNDELDVAVEDESRGFFPGMPVVEELYVDEELFPRGTRCGGAPSLPVSAGFYKARTPKCLMSPPFNWCSRNTSKAILTITFGSFKLVFFSCTSRAFILWRNSGSIWMRNAPREFDFWEFPDVFHYICNRLKRHIKLKEIVQYTANVHASKDHETLGRSLG